MKAVGLLVLCIFTLTICKPTSNLSDFLGGYFTALQVTAGMDKLLECADDTIFASWEKAVVEIAKVDWNDPISVLLGLTAFVQPAIDFIGMVEPCDRDEIAQLYQKIKAAVENRENFIHRVLQNIALVTDGLKTFLENWKAAAFTQAGSTAGAIVYWVFIV